MILYFRMAKTLIWKQRQAFPLVLLFNAEIIRCWQAFPSVFYAFMLVDKDDFVVS